MKKLTLLILALGMTACQTAGFRRDDGTRTQSGIGNCGWGIGPACIDRARAVAKEQCWGEDKIYDFIDSPNAATVHYRCVPKKAKEPVSVSTK